MRIKVFLLAVILAVTLVGCSEDSNTKQDSSGEKKQSQTQEKTREPKVVEATSSNKPVTVAEETTASSMDELAQETTMETTGGANGVTTGKTNSQEQGKKASGPKTDKKTGMLLSDTLVAGAADKTGGLLVRKRLITYYGHPLSDQMGILGQFEPQQMVDKLKQQTQAYTDADPNRPAVCGIELIASVAQPVPGPDGLYLTRTSPDLIETYAKAAKRNDCQLLLDVQIGYSNIADEVQALMPFLKRDYVHLAIDPEYDMDPGEIPGQQFGNSSGEEIMTAARTLSKLVKKEDLPPKILVIHQFRYDMLTNKQVIKPISNVEMVLHADGFGVPADKIQKYNLLVPQEPIQYGGFKLFYDQDVPLLSPEQVLELNPPPAVVSYQ